MTYFPFADYWWFYLGFTGFVLLLLALDLGVFHSQGPCRLTARS
jgi:tellurite resistance protein TerC